MADPIVKREVTSNDNASSEMKKFANPPPYPSYTFKVPDTRFDDEVTVLEGRSVVLR